MPTTCTEMSQFAEEYHKMNSRYDATTEGRKIKKSTQLSNISNMIFESFVKLAARIIIL